MVSYGFTFNTIKYKKGERSLMTSANVSLSLVTLEEGKLPPKCNEEQDRAALLKRHCSVRVCCCVKAWFSLGESATQ